MTPKKENTQTNTSKFYLAKAYQLKDLKGWISKKLIVPPGCTGIALFRDGKTDRFSPGENRVITDLDRFLGKGAGFWAGYIPGDKFSTAISVSNLISGDNKLIDLNLLCEVAVEDEKRFFIETVIPQGEISNQPLVLDLPDLFYALASMVRNYTADDLTGGLINSEISEKAQSLLCKMLPIKGIKFESIILMSLWNQEDRLAIEEQVFLLNQKLQDLELEKRLAQAENKEDFIKILNENGVKMPKTAGFFQFNDSEKSEIIKDWAEGMTSRRQPGHNFRLRSLLIKNEMDHAKHTRAPILKNWWVPRVIWIIFVVLAAIGATYYLKRASLQYEWLNRSEFFVTIWMFVLAAIIESVTKLFKQWENFFSDVPKPPNLLGLDDIKFKDYETIDSIIRDQSHLELTRQWEILNELRGKVYRAGDEDTALDMKQLELKLEGFLPKLKDQKVGKPVYLLDDIKLTKSSWSFLMDQEEVLLVKAALLTQSAQAIQADALGSKPIAENLGNYEAELDIFISDFIGRTRILHAQNTL